MDDQENERRGILARLAKDVFPFVHHVYVSITVAGVGMMLPILYKVFGEDSYIPLGITIILVATYFTLNVLTDRFARKFIDVEVSVFSLTIRLMELTIGERIVAAKEMALSLTYLGRLKERHSSIKLALLACTVVFVVLSFKFPALDLFVFASVSVATLGLLVLKEAVVEYRIRNGLFGTTRSEARELIDFIVKNSDDIDFTDNNGSLRKALLPEESKRGELKPHLTPGGATI